MWSNLRNIKIWVSLIIVLFSMQSIFGMPPRYGMKLPDEVRKAKALGLIDSPEDPIRDAGKKGYVNQPGFEVLPLVTGVKKMPCVLVYFTDQDTTYPVHDFQTQLFDTTGAWPTGSCYDYYREISYGQLSLIGTCYGWYNTGHDKNYYAAYSYGFSGKYPNNTAGLAMAAIEATDSIVDYAEFDNDGDGYVDCLWIIHSGKGAEETGKSTDIWSHSTRLSRRTSVYITDDPDPNHPGEYVKIDKYIVMPEISDYSTHDKLVSIGVFCHEFGHALGLPDLYDTDYSSEGIGNWGLMATGSWGGDGWSPWYPVHMCAWSKFKLGWVNPIIISNDSLYQVPAIENVPYFYILATNGNPTPECFFLENRQKVSFDQNLCNSGLLIYHIDDTIRTRNNREWYPGYTDFGHYLVAVEQADGDWDLERGVNRGDDGDPYPGSSNNRTFNDLSYPDSKNYDFGTSFIRVENISDSNDTMTCDIYVSSPTYNAAILSIDLPPDTVFAGCTYTPKATVKNCGTSNATLSVSCRIDSLWKTIYTDTVGEVFLVSGDKTQLTFCDWTVPSLGDKDQFRYKITVAAHLADDGYARDDSKVKTVVSTGLDYADHDIGNVTFTVTCWGSYGFTSVEQNQGSGFRYPANKTNWLSYGTLIAGNSPNYVVDRIKDNDWRVSPGGRLIMGRRMYSEQDGWATFDDSNHPTPKGLTIVQDSWAWSNTPYNDFVIIRYTIKNKGVAPINGLYIGQYMDFDMDATHYESNWGAVDVGKNLAYMWWYILQPYVGVKLLDGPVSNITIIHNPTYVYPDTGLADTTAFKFLSGEISLDLATAADDYSVMVAAGPFNLDVGDSTFVAFAVLGGDNLIDLKRNAIAAQEKYNQVVGIEEVASSFISSFTLFEAVPNPMGSKTTIGYQILEESKVTLGIYNICGQLVKTLVDAVQAPGHKSVIWNGENSKGYKVASGIYFYKLNVDGYTATKKMIVVR